MQYEEDKSHYLCITYILYYKMHDNNWDEVPSIK